MVLSHRAKFQLIINFFRVKAISTGLNSVIAWDSALASDSNLNKFIIPV